MVDGRVLGVDACRTGWVGICLSLGSPPAAYFAPGIDELVAAADRDGAVEVVAIDMPIGLPDRGPRDADLLVRQAIGPRRSSADRHLPHPKSTWAGVEQRRALLADAGITLTGDLGQAGAAAGVDDILDAAVTAWTAHRAANGQAHSLPNPPQTFSDALPSAAWY